MIRPENQPIDNVPPDLDPRTTPEQKLRLPRSSWQREAATALAALVVGALNKREPTERATTEHKSSPDESSPDEDRKGDSDTKGGPS